MIRELFSGPQKIIISIKKLFSEQKKETIYIYIYNVLFSPVKPESGIIPSGQKIIQL